MAPDWSRFVNNANAQAPTPATSTGPAKVTELTYHLLNRGYFPFEDIDPRVPITRDMLDVKCKQAKEFVQQWKIEGKAGTPMQAHSSKVCDAGMRTCVGLQFHSRSCVRHACATVTMATQEAVDVWIGLVGSNGPRLPDVATLVCWYQAPLEEMLKLNGASSGIMLKNIRTSAMHGDMMQSSTSPSNTVLSPQPMLGLMKGLLPPRLTHLHLNSLHCLLGSLLIFTQVALLQCHNLLSYLNLLQLRITHCLVSCLQFNTLFLQLRLQLHILGPQHYPLCQDHLHCQLMSPFNFLKTGLQECHLLLRILSCTLTILLMCILILTILIVLLTDLSQPLGSPLNTLYNFRLLLGKALNQTLTRETNRMLGWHDVTAAGRTKGERTLLYEKRLTAAVLRRQLLQIVDVLPAELHANYNLKSPLNQLLDQPEETLRDDAANAAMITDTLLMAQNRGGVPDKQWMKAAIGVPYVCMALLLWEVAVCHYRSSHAAIGVPYE
ncbi:hypothetical protein V8C86DRAFT_2443642 [Haematococcus lacustris]